MEHFTHLHIYTGYTIGKGICDIALARGVYVGKSRSRTPGDR